MRAASACSIVLSTINFLEACRLRGTRRKRKREKKETDSVRTFALAYEQVRTYMRYFATLAIAASSVQAYRVGL